MYPNVSTYSSLGWHRGWILGSLWLLLGVLAAPLQAQDKAPDRREPGPSAAGKLSTWQFEGSPAFEYWLPRGFDATKPITLTLMLHGSNLSRRWGFLNHTAGEFRSQDLVVCPDGTTPNGSGGFNFLQGKDDLEALHKLHETLRERFPIRATYLYGHSQGSFFALLYAGEYPDEVQGVVAHASGSWIGTKMSKKHHGQAIVHMHGSLDPVVPMGQSLGSHAEYRKQGYPLTHLRILQDYNHWPNAAQTGQALAWCEAMTTGDPEAAARNLAFLVQAAGWGQFATDYGAIFQAAQRLAALEALPENERKAAAKLASEVEAQGEKHLLAITKDRGKAKGDRVDGKGWSAHAAFFLREFGGVPAAERFAQESERIRAAQDKTWDKETRAYYQYREKDGAKASRAACILLEECFYRTELEDEHWTQNLAAWLKDGEALGLKKKEIKDLQAILDRWQDARKEGRTAYTKLAKGI